MRHIVYCWELGEGLGHLVSLTRIVAALRAQGHRVSCILKDLTHAPRLLGPLQVDWFPAPRLWAHNTVVLPLNHADILHNVGYHNPDGVAALLGAWRNMLGLLQPDRVICEYAPTAKLAACSLGLDVVHIDSGFSMPPLGPAPDAPLPSLRAASTGDLSASEQRTLDVINRALTAIGATPLACFAELFAGTVWYRNWTELNHFAPHSPDRHLGQLDLGGDGVAPCWPRGPGPKLFAYLKPRHPDSVAILRAALRLGYRVLAYAPGFASDAFADLPHRERFAASPLPFDFRQLPDDVELAIWHSATGGVARCLEKGMRMVFLPMHPEQHLACMAVMRAGLPAHVNTQPEDWEITLRAVASWPRLSNRQHWIPADVAGFAEKLAIG